MDEKKQNDLPKKKKKKPWKNLLNIFVVLIFTALSIFLTLSSNFDAVIENLKTCRIEQLLIVIGLMIVSIGIKALVLYCFARLFTKKYRYHQALAVEEIGTFYSAVTPGSSGGQIMQAYTYKKQGLHISSAVSALAMYSIVYQSVLILYGLISFIVKYDFIMSIPGYVLAGNNWSITLPIWPLTILGFAVNLGIILIVLLMSYWHGFHNFIMGPVISVLTRLKIVKNPDKSRESLRIQVENFKIEFRHLLTNIPFFILSAVLFFIYLSIKFSIPYFCGLALGNEHAGINYLWDSILLSNYHQMVSGLIPIPGGAGISELIFSQLFVNANNPEAGFFYIANGDSSALCYSALLLWRSITFIVPVFISGLTTAFYRSSPKEEESEAALSGRANFVALQNETMVSRKEEVDSIVETTKLTKDSIMKKLHSFGKKDSDKEEK